MAADMSYRTSIEIAACDATDLRRKANAIAAHAYPAGNFRFLAIRANLDEEIPATHIVDMEIYG